jgi:hypothetical protein
LCGEKLERTDLVDNLGRCLFCGTKPQRIKVCVRTIYACPSHPENEFFKSGYCSQKITDDKGNSRKCAKYFMVKSIGRSEIVISYKCGNEKCGYYLSSKPTLSGKCPKCAQRLMTEDTCKALLEAKSYLSPNDEKVKKAIEQGVKYLLDLYQKHGFKKPLPPEKGETYSEYVAPTLPIYTLICCGVPNKNPLLKEGIEYLLKTPLDKMVYPGEGEYAYIYSIPLAIMSLEIVDRVSYHDRIAELAQFIVDSQDKRTGGWGYPMPIPPSQIKLVPTPRNTITYVNTSPTREGTKVTKVTYLKKGTSSRDPFPYINHSSLQFALLGLRSAERSGVVIPEETWRDAKKSILSFQAKDGSWGYVAPPGIGYGSMTFAGIAGLIICKYYLGEKNYKDDPAITKGMEWINHNFVINENLQTVTYWRIPNAWYFYYFYCIERMGVISETESIDTIAWYPLLAEQLLSLQQEDGRWDSKSLGYDKNKQKAKAAEGWWSHQVIDTCFALLCLQKTTLALPPTGEKQPLPK